MPDVLRWTIAAAVLGGGLVVALWLRRRRNGRAKHRRASAGGASVFRWPWFAIGYLARALRTGGRVLRSSPRAAALTAASLVGMFIALAALGPSTPTGVHIPDAVTSSPGTAATPGSRISPSATELTHLALRTTTARATPTTSASHGVPPAPTAGPGGAGASHPAKGEPPRPRPSAQRAGQPTTAPNPPPPRTQRPPGGGGGNGNEEKPGATPTNKPKPTKSCPPAERSRRPHPGEHPGCQNRHG